MYKSKRMYGIIIALVFLIQLINPITIMTSANDVKGIQGDTFIEDVNIDGKVDISDISSIAVAYNSQSNDSKYKSEYDIDNNKIIDLFDFVKVSKKIGTNAIPYRVYNSSKLEGRYKSLESAKALAATNKNYHILDHNGKELWRSRYELYNGRSLKGRYNSLNDAKGAAGNVEGEYIRDAANGDKVVWQYVDPTVYGIVNASSLNVRSGPGTNYKKIGTLSNGTKVVILDSSNAGWHKIQYSSTVGYVSKDYINVQKPTPPPIPPLPGERRVMLDPGHGGSDPGAVGPSGVKEKDVVLKVALKARDMLIKKGYDVVMTRSTDVFVGLTERRELSNASGADFFVSIHANAYNSTAKGTETFGNPSVAASWEFANKLQRNMVSSFGLADRGRKDGSKLAVIRANNVPAALVELAFISNPKEEALLKSDAFQTKAAQAIVKSIEESYK